MSADVERDEADVTPSPATLARFWVKVDKTDTGWVWTAALDTAGYGLFRFQERTRTAHRLAYEWFVGPIPVGLELDHLCMVRNCVRPDHMEAVTHRENVLRSPTTVAGRHARTTHCPKGHEYTPENTYVNKGGRYCRTCKKANR